MSALKAGIAYVLTVFAVGFALGAIRVTFIAPATGPLAAVLLELPLMLTASWFAARWLTDAMHVPETLAARVMMGSIAFVLLMIIETLFGLAFGRSFASQLSDLQQPAGSGWPRGPNNVCLDANPAFAPRSQIMTSHLPNRQFRPIISVCSTDERRWSDVE
jgi:hypothetical protein